MLGRRIAARPRPPATVRDLEIALLEEWNSIPQSMIDNLIASMTNSTSSSDEKSKKLSRVREMKFAAPFSLPREVRKYCEENTCNGDFHFDW
ncbi:hypothetical protein TNCV_3707931 [Trichonephila clavipes]|nr:hypothetical protein TNCV_3707931 [Trichonephila clavipes]